MTFAENLKKSKRFTFRGCEENGAVAIPKTLFNFMLNISAYCTDEVANEEGFFKNKGAMFEALDLIYQALDEQLTLQIPRSDEQKLKETQIKEADEKCISYGGTGIDE